MENRRFFRKVRLCLCLYISLASTGCAVFKPGNTIAEPKHYRITAVGEYPLDIAALAEDAVITGWDKQPEGFAMSVRVNHDRTLEKLLFRLRAAGLLVRSATLEK